MSKTMLVNVTHVEESRVAILEDGVLQGYEIETLNRAHIKGNIYNAVVDGALPSLEAAFLRIGPDLKGFLPLGEINFKLLPARGERGKGGRIGQHLIPGQKLMVQVVREPFAGKPPTVSTYFSLPGRYLVLMPGVDSAGISRKIADSSQRDRLKSIVDELNPPEGFGVIVRTAGMGQTKVELQRDLRYLLRLWESIQRASMAAEFPGIVYQERDLVIRTIRDYFTPDLQEVWIDSKDTYERALEFVSDVMPTKAKGLRLYTGNRPLFNKYNLEEQIESIYKRRVTLPSGGEIIIDGTEALTAIDVNSARSSRKGDVEETITQTNLEAAGEIARQLRLRDLGGLVVIDFIDMMAMRNKKKVEKAMRDALKGDKAKHDITPISKLGLMEIARQRIKGEKMGATYASCPTCEGYGLVKNVEAAGLAALRKLQSRTARSDIGSVKMKLPPEVAVWILNNKRDALVRTEKHHGIRLEIEPLESFLRHEVSFETGPREAAEDTPPIPAAEPAAETAATAPAKAEPVDDSAREPDAPAGEEQETPAPRKRRRRRRRHSRPGVLAGGDATGAAATAPATAAPETGGGQRDPAHDIDARADTGATGSADEDTQAAGAGGTRGPARENGEPAAEADGQATGRKRRRRRRRRRPAAGAAAATTAQDSNGNEGAEPSPEPAETVEVVPRGVKSNELMPAAVRGSGGGRRSGSGRPRGGRRRSG